MNYHELAKNYLKEIDEQAILVELENHPDYYIFNSEYPGADLIIGDDGPIFIDKSEGQVFPFPSSYDLQSAKKEYLDASTSSA